MKKILIFLVAISVLLSYAAPVSAATVSMEYAATDLDIPLEENVQASAGIGERLELNVKSAILMEYNTGKVLYEANSDEKLAPASITKIMTLILVMEAIDSGKLKLEDQITASEHAASLGGSQIWLEPNEVMTVDELIRATVIASANDATVALAEAVAGTEESFVAMMNEKAKELGMNNTNFVNSYGLDADGHLTTAYDIALMSAELIKYDLIKNYTTVWSDSLRGGESELVNTNKLIRYYDGAFGLKTGTTSKAGSCLAATAQRDGMTLIAVVLGAPTSNDRFGGAKKLLDYGFANYSYASVKADTKDFTNIPVKKGTVREVIPTVKEEFSTLLKKGEEGGITQKFELETVLEAPVRAGDTVGYVHIYLNEEEIGVIPIVAENGSDRLTFWICLTRLFQALFTL